MVYFFFLMIRRPPRSTLDRSSAASDVYKRQAPGIADALKRAVAESCVQACLKIGYRGAGTFEFLYENGQFFFIEMNTRVQVEHPVTEAITGIDIVREQLMIASGQPLSIRQEDVHFRGHAFECRINACLLYTSPSPRDRTRYRMPSSA